jgi:hypothetical protein
VKRRALSRYCSVFLSGFLVTNTISALLAQQVRQIGIMKAVGTRLSKIMLMYMVLDVKGRETTWCVVGVMPVIGTFRWAWVNYDYYGEVAREKGEASNGIVLTEQRTREIGVMRAIDASDGSVLQIVIVEGIILGLVIPNAGQSWRFAHNPRSPNGGSGGGASATGVRGYRRQSTGLGMIPDPGKSWQVPAPPLPHIWGEGGRASDGGEGRLQAINQIRYHPPYPPPMSRR